ncbi:hypothetical protein [Streptomyces sp. WAC05292]|uniref:hypothetical protein n=1 Tax=Streptomyces sp. WAC05292 TaxID=2487418 RepID=UPI0021AF4843|nr:hypothetical protein [Streptomyces sp. WAC05292]
MRDLLLEGDVDRRYAGGNDSDEGYKLTMALAVGASQPGRAWAPADFHRALIYSPTAGGKWARRLRARKGTEYAEGKLTAMLDKARALVATRPAITCRQSAWEAIDVVRQAVERSAWPARGGGDTDLKNLTVRLARCEKAGGLEHDFSVRTLAEEMGCAKDTAARSNDRLKEAGWLGLVSSGAGTDHSSRWVLRCPEGVEDNGAGPGHPASAETRGGRSPVPVVHTDSRGLEKLVGHDAFHRYGHGTSGARLLTLLDVAEGKDAKELTAATGLHRTTVSRRLGLLVDDGFVVELEGLFYLAPHVAGPAGVERNQEALEKAAERRGTWGAGARRKARHQGERLMYRVWMRLVALARGRRHDQTRLRLVPEGVVDPVTGELTDRDWEGWDIEDPYRPVPLPAWAAQAS